MKAVGITQSHLLPPLLDPPPYGTLVDKGKRVRERMGAGYRGTYGRFAAILYEAKQTKEGHWIWKPTQIQCETRKIHAEAMKDAVILAEQNGQCRIYDFGLGNRRVS